MNQLYGRTPPPKTEGSTRSDDEHAALWLLYIIDGCSASDTARQMRTRFGTPETRNTIVGYAHRQKWPLRPAGGNMRSVQSAPARPLPPPRKTRPFGPTAATLANLEPVDPITGRRNGPRQCRFPVGPAQPSWRMADQLFCGKPQDPVVAPYCLTCAGRAYSPDAIRRKAANAAKN